MFKDTRKTPLVMVMVSPQFGHMTKIKVVFFPSIYFIPRATKLGVMVDHYALASTSR